MNRLLESLAACAGRPIAVKVSVAKPAAAHTKPKTQDDLREQAKKMPLVKKALEQFPGSKLTHAEE
ncbi:hypothetical protein GX586_04060 [bacterium]|nr:hypothetical protein [bacterium]